MHMRDYAESLRLLIFIMITASYVGAQTSPCPAGKYQNSTGACTDCPANTKPDAAGTNCVSGECVVCPTGSYCEGGTHMAACPAGTYNNLTARSAIGDCLDCAVGTYSPVVNSTSCKNCERGRYNSIVKQSNCIFCEPGKYQELEGRINCQSCGLGKYATGTGLISESSNCTRCPTGTFGAGHGFISDSNCTRCTSGTYGLSTGAIAQSNCSSCARGKYGIASGQSTESAACQNCSTGTYQPQEAQVFCHNCTRGTYNPVQGSVNSSSCRICPSNSNTLSVMSVLETECKCNMGYAGPAGGPTCTKCPAGKFANATGMLVCTNCSAGTQDIQNDEFLRDSPSTTCTPVPEYGYSSSGATSFNCHAGYRQITDGSTGERICQICPLHTFSVKGQDTCSNCVNGKTLAQGTQRIDDCRCNPGYYKPSNDTDCRLCPENHWCAGEYNQPVACDATSQYANTSGASSFRNCYCKAGYYGDNTNFQACTPCGINNFCPGRLPSSPQRSCPDNTQSPSLSFDIKNCSCRPGYQSTNAQPGLNCTLCPSNTFCLSGNLSACRQNSVAVNGSFEQSNCSCVPGYYSDTRTSPCKQCEKDAYCLGGTHRQTCATNYDTNNAVQQSHWTACRCTAGFYFNSSSQSQCHQCPKDKYCQGGNYTFDNCPANSQSLAQSSLATHCKCNIGYAGIAGGSCNPCPAGEYGNTFNLDSVVCYQCGAGKYSTGLAMRAAADCKSCVAGTFNPYPGSNAESACTKCGLGKYSVDVGQISESTCQNCGKGKYSPTTGSNTSANCLACAQGKFQTIDNAGSASDCKDCGMGKYSLTPQAQNSGACINCTAGTWSNVAVAADSGTCTKCDAGKISTAIAAIAETTCKLCAKGKYSTGAGMPWSVCTNCMNGTYNNVEGASTTAHCTNCAAGKYGTGVGRIAETECTQCVAGTYNMIAGKTARSDCLDCVRGKYSVIVGSNNIVDCQDCGAGKYNTNTGSNSTSYCTNCGKGKYSGTAVASAESFCISCVPGKANNFEGKTMETDCSTCAVGSFSGYAFAQCTGCQAGSVLREY